MSDTRTSLDIEIRTIADLQGIRLTEGELQRVKERVQQLRSATEQQATATDTERQALRERAQEALRNIEADEKAAGSKRKATDASAALGKELRGLQQAGQGLNQVMEGLATGGIGGFIQAGRGAVGMLRSLAGGMLQLGPLAIAAASGLFVLRKAAEQNEKDMQRMWDAAAAGAERYAKAVEAAEARASASLDRMKASISKAIADYDKLTAASDRAQARVSATNAANKQLDLAWLDEQEQAALAKARTPAERDKLAADFALKRKQVEINSTAGDIAGQGLQAGVRRDNAQAALRKFRGEFDVADAAVRDAEDRAAELERDALSLGQADTPEARAIRKDALAAREAVKLAEKNREEARSALESGTERATREIEQADLDDTLARKRGETEASRARTALGGLDGRRRELRAAARSAQEEGRSADQDAAVRSLAALEKEARLLKDAAEKYLPSVTNNIKRTGDQMREQDRRLKAAGALASGGGG